MSESVTRVAPRRRPAPGSAFSIQAHAGQATAAAGGVVLTAALALWFPQTAWAHVVALVLLYGTGNSWLVAIKNTLKQRGLKTPAEWLIWFGWMIPLVNLVAPVMIMRDLGRAARAPHLGFLLTVWWLGWWGFTFAAASPEVRADAVVSVSLTPGALACGAVSMAAAAVLIRRITRATATP